MSRWSPKDEDLLIAQQIEGIDEFLELLTGQQIMYRAEKIIDIIQTDIAIHFRSAEGPQGPWPPRKHQYPHPPLIKTGRMMRAASARTAPGNITRNYGDEIVIGIRDATVPYAKYQRYGTQHIDAREFLWISDEAAAEIDEIMLDLLEATFLKEEFGDAS